MSLWKEIGGCVITQVGQGWEKWGGLRRAKLLSEARVSATNQRLSLAFFLSVFGGPVSGAVSGAGDMERSGPITRLLGKRQSCPKISEKGGRRSHSKGP